MKGLNRSCLLILCICSLLCSACGKRKQEEDNQVSIKPTGTEGVTKEFDPPSGHEGFSVVGKDIPLSGSQVDMGRYFDPDYSGGEDAVSTGAGSDTDILGGDTNAPSFVFKTVYFEFDSHRLTAKGREVLQAIGEYLLKNESIRVVVEGHCDERGSDTYNLALGEKRALSVREFLVAFGVGANRLHTVSFGEEEPVEAGQSENAYSKNRRAQFRIAVQ